MKEQIKKIRKELDLTQQKFAYNLKPINTGYVLVKVTCF